MDNIQDYKEKHLSARDDIPELDIQTADQLLNNILSACEMPPNTIPIDVLQSWGNYYKPRFNIVSKITYIIIVLLILLPLMFFKPAIVAERTNVDSAKDAAYKIEIRTLLPISSVTASLDGTPVALKAADPRHYTAEVTDNGTLEITAIAFNGQIVTRTYTVAHIDTEKPVFIDSYSKDGYVYILVQDTYSGIDYENISGLVPEAYDEDTGLITFRVPDVTTTLTIPDKAGNEISLLLSPVK